MPPTLLKGVEPVYPPEARDEGIDGDVLVLLTVGADGFVYEVELVQGPHSLLNMAAMDAAELLMFTPATQGGVAVPVQINYRFRFDLGIADEQGTAVPGSLHGVVQDLQGLTVPNAQIEIIRTDDQYFEPLHISSKQDGSFRVTFLPSGEYEVTVTFPGFTDAGFLIDIEAGQNLRRGFTIVPEGEMTIVVTWEERTWREVERAPLEPNVEAVTGAYTLTRRDIEATPGSMEDVSRAVHALPGIVSDGDMLATFNARGGETTDVVFLIDRVPLDNPFHLAGFNSLFNPDLISTVQFYAGTAPANVPSGTSAVLAVETWDGQPRQDAADIDGAVDISASSIRLLAMGPIGERANIAMAARRSYMETYFQVMKWANVIDTSFAAPEFSEYSARFAWRPIPRHRVMVTAMQSGDSLAIIDSPDESIINVDGTFELSNALSLTSIDHRFVASDELTWQTTSAWTRDRSYMLRDLGGQAKQEVTAHRWFARTDLTWTPGKHEVLTGVDGSWHLIDSVGEIEDSRLPPTWYTAPIAEYATTMVELDEALGYADASVYLQETWKGPAYLRAGARTTWNGATNEVLVSPSAGISVPLKTGTVPKASWGIYHRTPKDPRVLDNVIGNPDLHSERAQHFVVGIDQGFPLPWEEAGGLLRVEAYRIELTDLIVSPDNQQAIDDGTSWENAGSGRNQGLDVMLGARAGRASGMATYSYLVATRTNPLNEQFAQTYAPGQDQRHTLGTSLEYQLTPRWRGTVRYSFHTGRPVSSIVPTTDDLVMITGLNDQRLGSFHNLDVRGEWRKAMDNYRLSFYAEVLNVANFHSDFVPTAQVSDGELTEGMLEHLPIRPFLGLRADF
ncbi:MAG: TonB-dependent receptor [Proteobacteria bacterium]|nr:TonB-dependent receptor [Pseudomonadota bacterium]